MFIKNLPLVSGISEILNRALARRASAASPESHLFGRLAAKSDRLREKRRRGIEESSPQDGVNPTLVSPAAKYGAAARGWAGVDFAETTKDGPEAIVGSAIGRLPHRKWLDFVSQTEKAKLRATYGRPVYHW